MKPENTISCPHPMITHIEKQNAKKVISKFNPLFFSFFRNRISAKLAIEKMNGIRLDNVESFII
jgi:hypothetical protein